jgi:PAS domain S-box-containing protein
MMASSTSLLQSVPPAEATIESAAEETLRLRNQAVESSSNGIVIADARQPDQPIIYVNPAFLAMTGYVLEEVLGRNCRFLQAGDHDQSELGRLRRAIGAGEAVSVTLRNYRKDGVLFWNELSVSPIFDKYGHLTHFVGVQTDITRRKEAEEENARLVTAMRDSARRERAFLRDVLSSVTEGRLCLCDDSADLPVSFELLGDPVHLSSGDIATFRHTALEAASARELPLERCQDLVTAVSEAAMNAVVHGGGGQGRVCVNGNGTVQVWVTDQGGGIAMDSLPRATLERGYTTAGSLGHGLWLILNTVDRLWLLTGPSGTTVVLEQDRAPQEPAWLREA